MLLANKIKVLLIEAILNHTLFNMKPNHKIKILITVINTPKKAY